MMPMSRQMPVSQGFARATAVQWIVPPDRLRSSQVGTPTASAEPAPT